MLRLERRAVLDLNENCPVKQKSYPINQSKTEYVIIVINKYLLFKSYIVYEISKDSKRFSVKDVTKRQYTRLKFKVEITSSPFGTHEGPELHPKKKYFISTSYEEFIHTFYVFILYFE